MTQFTANEVRRQAKELFAHNAVHQRAMLDAFADMLEADEKAVPVAFRYQAQQVATGAWVWSGWLDLGDPGIASLHVHCKTADSTKIEYAYAYAPPSDTERLAEALHSIGERLSSVLCDPFGEVVVRGSDDDRQIIAQALKDLGELAAHSAQAQPPYELDPAITEKWENGELGRSLEYAQVAQPPAASVTDAMVDAALTRAVIASKESGIKGPTRYMMRAALEAALAAQENPNG